MLRRKGLGLTIYIKINCSSKYKHKIVAIPPLESTIQFDLTEKRICEKHMEKSTRAGNPYAGSGWWCYRQCKWKEQRNIHTGGGQLETQA